MRDPLLWKALRDLRFQVVGWGVSLGLMLAMVVLFYPSVAGYYEDLIGSLSPTMQAFLGAQGGIGTFAGYVKDEAFSYLHVVLAVFAILAGTNALRGEEAHGTLELLLAQPVSRARLAVVRFGALALACCLIVVLSMAAFWASLPFLDESAPHGRMAAAFLLLVPFTVAVAYLSAMASLLLPSRLIAGSLAAVTLVGSYIVESLANVVTGLRVFRPLMPTYYFQGDEALVSTVSMPYLLGTLGMALAALLAAVVLFQRRDIGVQRATSAHGLSLWRRRGAASPGGP